MSLFSSERVEYSSNAMSENSPHVCSEKSVSDQEARWLEPTTASTKYKRRALAITTVGH
jgi:hypothetical protein